MGDDHYTEMELIQKVLDIKREDIAQAVDYCFLLLNLINIDNKPDWEKYFTGIKQNKDFQRKILKRKMILADNSSAIEYLSKDIRKGDFYNYDDKLEESIMLIDQEIVGFVSSIVNSMEGVSFDALAEELK